VPFSVHESHCSQGVLADYADAKQKMELLHRVQNEVAWLNVAELGTVAATVREQEELDRRAREAQDKRASSDEEDQEGDDDIAFLAQYRQKRLAELKTEQAEAIRAAYRPTFGSLLALTADQLSETLDAKHPDTFVIVHLMEPHVQLCAQLNAILTNLARRLPYNKFVKISASDAADTLSADVLPTLIVFKGGEQVRTWVRFLDQLGPLSEDAVTAWLLKEKVLTLDDEQLERMTTAYEGRIEQFQAVELVDPVLLRKLTEILK
jgi:hypothetical protein